MYEPSFILTLHSQGFVILLVQAFYVQRIWKRAPEISKPFAVLTAIFSEWEESFSPQSSSCPHVRRVRFQYGILC